MYYLKILSFSCFDNLVSYHELPGRDGRGEISPEIINSIRQPDDAPSPEVK